MYDRLLLCCWFSAADGIFATVSNQCPQGPPFREISHLNVAVMKIAKESPFGMILFFSVAARIDIARRKARHRCSGVV
jgi:hypothetical protein